MAPIVSKNLLGGGLIDRDRGNAVDYFPTHLPRLFADRLPFDHKSLAHRREVEIVIQFCANPDFSCFNPTVFATAGMAEVGGLWGFRGNESSDQPVAGLQSVS